MRPSLKLFNLGPSPNNITVRLALGYKKLACEMMPVNPTDRTAVVEASGQPLTPVLLHGDTVVFDSHAIIRYLDANFPDTPRLFATDRETMKEIEAWELWCRHEPSDAVGLCFREAFKKEADPDNLKRAHELLHVAADRLEAVLMNSPFLVGDNLTAADILVAPWIHCGMLPEEVAERFPPARLFIEHLRLEQHESTRAWAERIMAYDRQGDTDHE